VKRLVCYSVTVAPDDPRPDLLRQLEISVRSLRAFNDTIPIRVFAYGEVATDLVRLLGRFDVTVHQQGSYEDRLAGLLPDGCDILGQYPVLHKFFNFREIDALNPRQVLLLDCDTVLAGDVNRLFRIYSEADCYWREDVGCGRSPRRDPRYLDETILARIEKAEHVRAVPPFNCGVVLLNNRVWRRLPDLDARLVSYAWRFVLWMALNPVDASSPFGELRGIRHLRQRLYRLDCAAESASRALPYPSANRWIVEQVSMWLTLGHVRGVTYRDFSKLDVLYADELLSGKRRKWLLCHYFRTNQTIIESWMTQSSDGKTILPAASRRAIGRLSAAAGRPPDVAIPAAIRRSPLVEHAGGFAIYTGLPDTGTLRLLYEEARAAYATAKPQEWWGPDRDEDGPGDLAADRHARPRRCYFLSLGGPVQAAMCQSAELSRFLSSECGMPIRPTARRGSYTYYTRTGDFLDLHRDIESCDVAMITVLHDNTSPSSQSGALVVYSDRIAEPLSAIQARPDIGGQTIKLSAGQTIVMFGGIVPHRVLPVAEGQTRIVSVLCFRAFARRANRVGRHRRRHDRP
jgi:hypothetical protein